MAERSTRIRVEVAGLESIQADLELLAEAAKRSPELGDALASLFGTDGVGLVAGVDVQWDGAATCFNMGLHPALAGMVACLRVNEGGRTEAQLLSPSTEKTVIPPVITRERQLLNAAIAKSLLVPGPVARAWAQRSGSEDKSLAGTAPSDPLVRL